MLHYNCIIIEDEPLAIEILEEYIALVPSLKLLHVFTDALAAQESLQLEKIDLIFLDIHLPKLKGLDFLAALKNCPPVIITSAYHQYALESYNYTIIDYLLKPFEFERFLKSINKFKAYFKPTNLQSESEHILVNVGKKKVKITISDISYIESIGAYVKIFTSQDIIITKLKISELENWFEDAAFIRIHRSFLVAKNKINSFTATTVELTDKNLPIGRNYKEETLKILNKSNNCL